jgi:hypothetical protein
MAALVVRARQLIAETATLMIRQAALAEPGSHVVLERPVTLRPPRSGSDSFIALAAAEVQSAAGVAPHRRPRQGTGMASQENPSRPTHRPGPTNDERSVDMAP